MTREDEEIPRENEVRGPGTEERGVRREEEEP